jgi:hypothetical protein
MAKLLRVLLGMRTLFEGTDSPIALSINDVQINFSDTAQADQEMGQANLYDSDVTRFDIDTAELNNSSIRVVILGDDQWAPVIVVAWAELPDNVILPLAIEFPNSHTVSTDATEGNALLPLHLVGQGVGGVFTRLLLMMTTNAGIGSGTDSIINLTVRGRGGQRLVDFDIPETAQDDQETGQANLYFVPVDVPFTRNDLEPGAITITTAGGDQWLPANMFLFGLDGLGQEQPTFLAPLVHIRNWQLGPLSTQAGEGKPTVTLPLVPG